jgi:hypothetical protein
VHLRAKTATPFIDTRRGLALQSRIHPALGTSGDHIDNITGADGRRATARTSPAVRPRVRRRFQQEVNCLLE